MDTLKLVYTQLEAFDLVDEYTEAYKEKINQLEEENKRLEEENKNLKEDVDYFRQFYLDLKKLCEK